MKYPNMLKWMDAETAGRLELLGFSVRRYSNDHSESAEFYTPLFKVGVDELNSIVGFECYYDHNDNPIEQYIELWVVFSYFYDGHVSGWICLSIDGQNILEISHFEGSNWKSMKEQIERLLKMRE